MNIIILAGVPGSGKSSVIEEAARRSSPFATVNYGDVMLREAARENLDRDALRKLPPSAQQEFGIRAAHAIRKIESQVVLIDTHALIKTAGGYVPGIPEAVARLLNPKVIATVECAAALIHERRLRDGRRQRDVESIEQIEYHQQLSRSSLLACTVATGALFAPIQNHGPLQEAAKHLAELISLCSN